MQDYIFKVDTQREKRGQVHTMSGDDMRTQQLLQKGFIEPYTPVQETKVVAPKETKRRAKKVTK